MKLLFVVLCLLGFHQALCQTTRRPTTPAPGCPPGFLARPNSRSCYYFISSSMNWFDADQYCTTKIPRSYAAHLADIDSLSEQQWVENYIKNDKDLQNNNFWIGADNMDRKTPFTWTWTGRPFSYTNWAPGQPNKSGKCVQLWYDSSYRWDDEDCTSARRYGVCEYTY